MRTRVYCLIKYYVLFVLFFVAQKTVFTWVNADASAQPLHASDYWDMMRHGLGLDLSTTGYLTAIPFAALWISLWTRRNGWLHPTLMGYTAIVSVLVSLICIADTALYAFWKFKIDATVLNYLDAPKQALASVSAGYVLGQVALIAVCSVLLTLLVGKSLPHTWPQVRLDLRMILHNLAFALMGGLLFLGIRGGVGRSTMNVGTAYYSENVYLNHAAINPAFNLLYSWRKVEDFADKYNYLDEATRQSTFAPLYPEHTTGSTCKLLNTSRPNILFIILEGFGGEYVKSLGSKHDANPNMERLIAEGIFFDNLFANSFRTDRGLVSILSGHWSYPTFTIMKSPAKSGKLPGIAHTLHQAGYATDLLYAGDINFTNMKSYFTGTGYQSLTCDKDFSLAERTSSSWGAHDEYAFARLLEMLKTRPADKRWHTTILTLSSHEPFEVPYQRLEDQRANAFAYTDHCLGAFIDSLKTLPLWNDLLVVCLPDHGSSPTFNTSNPTFYHIPMLWLGGAVAQRQTIHTLMSQSDLAATLLDQLDLPHDDFPYSRNIFSANYTYPFVYSTFSDGFMFSDSTGVTVYDNAAGHAVLCSPDDGATREKKGQAILQTTYDILATY